MTALPAAAPPPLPRPEATDDLPVAAIVADDRTSTFGRIEPCPNPLRHPFRCVWWLLRSAVGLVAVVLVLSALAAIPVVNVLALGYLLEAEGRVARGGKLRHGFPLLGWAPRIGSITIGLTAWLFPLSLLSGYAADARLIDPASPVTRRLSNVLAVASIAVAVHLCLALARGGRLGCFFRPLKNLIWFIRQTRRGGYWQRADDHLRHFIAGLRLGHHFSLGLRGFLGGFAWLVLPTALFAAANGTEGGPFLVTLIGAFWLMLVLAWLPFLQARFAAENRLRAMFELRTVRHLFKQAPLAWLLAVLVAYTLALPLYLSKIALPPRDAAVLLTPLFIVSIYPARLLTGWAYARAARRPRRAWFGWRWTARLLLVPTLATFVFLLFFTQFIGEHGKRVLFEHHALLLPVPF